MDAARFQKVKDIFAEAAELSAAHRTAFLRARCGADDELYAEVRSLLAAHDEPEHLIEKNAFSLPHELAANGAAPVAADYAGKRFGNYEIVREIGRGGMGAVFLAERADGEFNQRVALKIVRRTVLDDETERHFRREREILAALNHPNIARLYDGGVSDAGEVFLAMEYVEGETLLEYAENKDLSVEQRLRLFLKICAAVAYAHRNLTVHRDLKPSNILVTGDGEPKLLDFGLAKMSESDDPGGRISDFETENNGSEGPNFKSQIETTVFRAFTPAYASPEQILGRAITTASDIYSLGVVFYELLAGDKPFHFEDKSLEEIIDTLTNSEPNPPSSAMANFKSRISDSKKRNPKLLKGDLDSIALKALQKEPERRYKTVEGLTGDIERHLNDLPVLARPAGFSYRAAKYFRRNRIAVSAAAVVFLSVVTGLAFTLWQANETRKERDRAEQRFNDVRKLSTSLLFEIAPKIENLNGTTEARELLVKNALEYLDSLSAETHNDITLKAELAAAYEKVGDLQGNPNKPNLSDFTGAVSSLTKANEIRRELPATAENQILLAGNFLRSSEVRYVQNDVKGAIGDSEAALRIYESLAPNSDSPDIKFSLFETRINTAQIYSNINQYKTAIPLLEGILADFKELNENEKNVRVLRVRAETIYAKSLSWDDRQAEAEAQITKTVEAADRLLSEFPDDAYLRQQIWQTFSTASSVYENSKNQISYAFIRKAATLAESAVAADPADMQSKQNLAKSYSRAGFSKILLGDLSEGLEYLKKSEKISRELVEKEPKNISYQKDFGRLYIRFGDFYRGKKDYAAALENYRKSVFYFQAVQKMDEKDTVAKRDAAQSMKNVGEIEALLGRKADAAQTFRQALEILTALDAQNALAEYDRKMIADVQAALQKL
ncbi:MAG: serine/threonine protein kinase [Acidobacteria bacterium]|nr:serine/threonine protein kinase [Acidobacteriota bacterium]